MRLCKHCHDDIDLYSDLPFPYFQAFQVEGKQDPGSRLWCGGSVKDLPAVSVLEGIVIKPCSQADSAWIAMTAIMAEKVDENNLPPPIKHKALLNVDLGEGYGNFKCGPDDEILPLIDHANIACGFHAGDPLIMDKTVQACKKYGVKCGAHPGYPDVVGFGRREIAMDPDELTAMVRYQVGALKGFLDAADVPLHHVKPHGKLYGVMCRDYNVARAVMEGVPRGVPVFGLAGTNMEKAANDLGLTFWAELYGDVKYSSDGMLVIDRVKKKWDEKDVRAHISQQLNSQSVTAVDGQVVKLPLKDYPVSVCCHSDSPGCMDIIKTVKSVIDEFNQKHGR